MLNIKLLAENVPLLVALVILCVVNVYYNKINILTAN